METIVFAGIIIALAVGAIWFYNRGSRTLDVNGDGVVDSKDVTAAVAKTAAGIKQDTRDIRDIVLSQASESAARVQSLIEAAKISDKPAKPTTARKSAAKPSGKKATEKKPAVRAKTVGTGRTRTKKST